MSMKIGIDLGTTYSCVAYLNDDKEPVIEKNYEGEDNTPSVVLFNENGEILVGSSAKDLSMMYPAERIVTCIKNEMGKDFKIEIDGTEYNPSSISALILKKMINDFNESKECEVKEAVITCPAYFGQKERDATILAGKIAGLQSVTIINEPTAAAISFGYGKVDGGSKRILVYDLGGGTFDVTILDVDGDVFTAIATDGSRNLGGKNWDIELSNLIKTKVSEESGLSLEEIDSDSEVSMSLVNDSEIIKKRLSTAETTRGTLTTGGIKTVFNISRREFESATRHLLDKTLDITDRVLASKGFTIDEIDEIVLVGGSSKMPQVKNAISAKYPTANINIFDPNQSIAKGAALCANYTRMPVEKLEEKKAAPAEPVAEVAPVPVPDIEPSEPVDENIVPEEPAVEPEPVVVEEPVPEPEPEPGIIIHNILSKTFGIKAICDDKIERVSNIIFRNEILPIQDVKTYHPSTNDQAYIRIEIFENSALHNEDGKYSSLNESTPIGDFMMELPDGNNTSTSIVVRFTATEEGILKAHVECLGKSMDYEIENNLKMSEEEIRKSRELMDKVVRHG